MKVFEERGLLARSVSVKTPRHFNKNAPPRVEPGASVSGQSRECFSYMHPDIGQSLFQVSPENIEQRGNRCMAILVDWASTWQTVITASTQDESSNQAFSSGNAPTSRDAVQDQLASLIGAQGDSNEVRCIGIDNAAIVGFIFGRSTSFGGGQTWEMAKPWFQRYVDEIVRDGQNQVTARIFPVFEYTNQDGHVTLQPLDLINAKGFVDAHEERKHA